jgi:transposase, IS30 family
MPKGYHHLTHSQRCQIYALNKSGLSQAKIAKIVGVSQATVSRELARNRGLKGYRHKQAHEKALARRRKASSVPRKMTRELIAIIERLLREAQLSPEQISGRLDLELNIKISDERIYQHIWRDKRNGGDLYKNLRHSGKKYNKRSGKLAGRGLIPNRVGIEHRPDEVAAKIRVGDFEGDTIAGANHRGAIVSLVDRKTKYVFLRLIQSTKADITTKAIIDALKPIKEHVYTITTDNGKEFADHATVAKVLDLQYFFANPYHSWERGLNENTNGLVRQYFPKGTDFTKLTTEQVLAVEIKLNNRPRKTLGYKTPREEFLHLTGYALHY